MKNIAARLRCFEGSDALGDGDFSVCRDGADYIEWQERLLQWCKARLRRDGHAETLDRYLAAGPTAPDMTPVAQSSMPQTR